MSLKLRVLIAEDDAFQRHALVDCVVALKPDWEVVAAVDGVPAVLSAMAQYEPQLLILDIHLPGHDDLGWLRDLDPDVPAIFVTGDAGFALEAFDLSAVDYVLKPVSMKRLRAALDKLEQRQLAREAAGERSSSADGSTGPGSAWITMSKGQDVIFAAPDEIVYLQADQKYTRVVTERGEGLVRSGITELLGRLDERVFVRVHRSSAVNVRHVSAVRRNDLGFLEVHLRGRSEVLKVSKSFQQAFKAL